VLYAWDVLLDFSNGEASTSNVIPSQKGALLQYLTLWVVMQEDLTMLSNGGLSVIAGWFM